MSSLSSPTHTIHPKTSQATVHSPTPTIHPKSSQVTVQDAKETFAKLERQLSRASTLHRELSEAAADLEKGQEGEVFDLREYLSSVNTAQDDAGIISHHKRVGVSWSDLEVIVPGGGDFKIYALTFGQAVINFFFFPLFYLLKLSRQFRSRGTDNIGSSTILHKNNGVLQPGEMCLVLGCPGAGCTTFLKTISNQREGYAYVGGNVQYAGIDAAEMAKRYKGEVVYNQEDDVHIPTLTVGQTLNFALATKTPGKRLPGVSRKEFNSNVLGTLLRMFNIRHTERTLVGNAFVRGVSGGERKRVSIAEMMATRAHVTCWDNSTRGLDASTALDYVKSLRIFTDVLQQTTFVSLYQASESIYQQFDKVLVIDKGRQVFFGPISEARAYFIGLGYKDLPRQTTSDYLTGCTDPNERQFAPGQSAATVPSTPAALEATWRKSPLFHALETDRIAYTARMAAVTSSSEPSGTPHEQAAFRAAVLQDKRRGVSKKSPYTLGFLHQVRALTARQFQLRLQDRFQLYSSFGMAITLALVLGGAFFDLPQTAGGGFTRGSILFIAMLVCCFDAFGEMPSQMLGRPILYKQTGYGFYRPAAIAIANLLADLPFSMVRILIFNIIIYFMTNLTRTAGAFFTYHLFMVMSFLSMQAFFRFFGVLCTNFDVAFRLATFFMPNFISYTGYFTPPFKMKRWLFWIYYVNPLSYGFSGLLTNEFMNHDIPCDGNFVVPRNGLGLTKYPDTLGPNQACTLFGAKPGSPIVKGPDYLQTGFELNVKNLWRLDLVVLIGIFLLFQALQLLTLEYFKHGLGGAGVHIFVPENEDTKKRNAKFLERKDAAAAIAEKKNDMQIEEVRTKPSVLSGKIFTWENLNYHVPVPGGQKRLLHDVFGYVKPGSLTALMGASGAGKTTCLDVLAQRKNIGVVTGNVLVDGRPLAADFARGTSYAEQMDVHEITTTVREAMRFSAYLRQPFSVPQSEKDDYVEEMIELLELQDLADVLVLSLGVEARKRLTIGVELAARPELLLFLDEPTSGLDGQSAWNLVRFLRKLADAGQAILCTIHQPSALLFESFDRLLLLESGGETVYFGDIGEDSYVIRDYFARNGAICPPDVNPAEFMLEVIGAGVTPRVGPRDWKDIWLDSHEYVKVKEDIRDMNAAALSRPSSTNQELAKMYATPFFYQVKEVTKRSLTALWRSPDYVWTRLFVHAFISLFVSLSLLQLGTSTRDLQSRIFGIFFSTIMPAIVMFQIEPAFLMNRMIFIREASSRIYSPYVFAISQLVSEIPYSLLCAVVYWVLMVWPMGFGKGAEGTNGNGYQLLMCILLELFGVSLGQVVAAISPSIQIAALYNPVLLLILSTFAGVTIPYPQLTHFWKSWLYQLTPFTRVLSGMLSTELHGLPIKCAADEFATFTPPIGQTCQDWAGEFVNKFGGYLENVNATDVCRYCQYKIGDEFFLPLNIQFDNRWRDVFLLFAYFVANIFFTIIASRFLRFAKR